MSNCHGSWARYVWCCLTRQSHMVVQMATSHASGLLASDGFHYGSSDRLWCGMIWGDYGFLRPLPSGKLHTLPRDTVLQSSLGLKCNDQDKIKPEVQIAYPNPSQRKWLVPSKCKVLSREVWCGVGGGETIQRSKTGHKYKVKNLVLAFMQQRSKIWNKYFLCLSSSVKFDHHPQLSPKYLG